MLSNVLYKEVGHMSFFDLKFNFSHLNLKGQLKTKPEALTPRTILGCVFLCQAYDTRPTSSHILMEFYIFFAVIP